MPFFKEDVRNFELNFTKKKSLTYKSHFEREYVKAIELGLSDYLSRNKFKKVLLGLSGGVDSSVVAALMKENGYRKLLICQFRFKENYG